MLKRLYDWLADHGVCPCSLTCRLTYGQPAFLGWVGRRGRLKVCGLGSALCVWFEDTYYPGEAA